jgi:hypothetical protein
VAEKLLDGTDVASCLEEVRGEGMTERVTRRRLADAGHALGNREVAANEILTQVGASQAARRAIDPQVARRE